MKKIIKVFAVIIFSGFSFFYTEKVTKIIRKKDPIMIKLNEAKKDSYISVVKPIINDDEYIAGINGCTIDINKSYNKMKTVKEYKKELIVMKEVNTEDNLKNKYIVGANKLQRKVSIAFIIKDNINKDLIDYLDSKKIKTNFFVDLNYLKNNGIIIKLLSEKNNIYYLGDNYKYNNEGIKYANRFININTNNSSNYCITEKKDEKKLNICSDNNMKIIKTDIIRDNLLNNVQNKLSNGSIIAIDTSDIEKIKISINYILSRGYEIVKLDELLNHTNKCNK